MADAEPAVLRPPASLTAIRSLTGQAEVSQWERDVVEFLQPHSKIFTQFPHYFRVQGLNFQLLRQLLPEYFSSRHQVILELGCGTGLHSLFLSAHAERVIGVDIPGEYIDYVQPPFSSSAQMASFLVNKCFAVSWAEFKDAFPDRLGLAANSVDLAFSWTVLEHVPELEPVFGELSRVLRSGGLMINVVPSIMSGLMTLVQANLAAVPSRRWSIRRYLGPRPWVVPELHSEFLRDRATYEEQLNLYLVDTFIHPMLDAGFVIEKLLWLRDFNVAIVARKT